MIVRFSARAAKDLTSVFDYGYSFVGEDQAEAYGIELESRIVRMLEHPEIGFLVHRGPATIRRFGLPPYIIDYRIEGDIIMIHRIMHHRADRPD